MNQDGSLVTGSNTGVRIDPIRPTDFIAGSESGAIKTTLEGSGQYDLWLPDEEAQYRSGFDNFGCVSESANNDLETILNWKIAHGLVTAPALNFLKSEGYIDPLTNKVNFSDRWLAKVSGTSQNGNSCPAVGDAIRHIGLVPEKRWPWPTEIVAGMSQQEAWDIYYKTPPQELFNLAARFLAFFAPSYEWIVLQGQTVNPSIAIKNALVYGPVQFITKVCPPWNSNEANPPISACGIGTGHATCGYGYRAEDNAWKDFDTYKSYRKLLAWDYSIPYAFQYHISETQLPQPPTSFHYVFNVNLKYGNPANAEVHKLQEALQYLKYMKAGVFGYYGPATRDALAKFQAEHDIPGDAGNDFGPKTRSAINKLI